MSERGILVRLHDIRTLITEGQTRRALGHKLEQHDEPIHRMVGFKDLSTDPVERVQMGLVDLKLSMEDLNPVLKERLQSFCTDHEIRAKILGCSD